MFRAVSAGFRSSLVSSAAAAGLIILRKFGKEAQGLAYDHFVATHERKPGGGIRAKKA